MLNTHEITRPYPGLRPFESWEGEIFFGREEHTDSLLEILKKRHFLTVTGPSGSGKSSLVRAGLLPALPLGSLGTGADWRIALMRPGNRPMRSLAISLLAPHVLGKELENKNGINQNETNLTTDLALLETELRRGPLGLVDIVQDARCNPDANDSFNLLVLVDQFEELFTYSEAGGHKTEEAEAFVNLLLTPQKHPETRIFVVLTMRTDFLGECVRFLELPDTINRSQYLTPRLSREQVERAIVGPAYLFDGSVEPTLVGELINSIGQNSDQLPILQHALSRMWDQAKQRHSDSPAIIWSDFKSVGGLNNALSIHADEILTLLSPETKIDDYLTPAQQAAADLFRAITEQRSPEAGGQAVRKPQSLERIALWTGRKWQDFIPVIEMYGKEGVNFLSFTAPLTKDSIIDISHEALIRQWRRLRRWVGQEARLVSEYKRIRSRAEDYQKGAGALLTGADLERALEWQHGAINRGPSRDVWAPNANWADRYRKSDDIAAENEFNHVISFINKSHSVVISAKKRARILKRALLMLTWLSLIATVGAFGFAYQAYKNQIKAEAALLWNPLDFTSPGIRVNKKQAKGLLKLSESNDAQKRGFFTSLIKDPALAERFLNNPEAILSALAGISLERKNDLISEVLSTDQNDTDLFRLTRFVILSELESRLESRDVLSVITIKDSRYLPARKLIGARLKSVIANFEDSQVVSLTEKILASFNEPASSYETNIRAEALEAVIAKLGKEQYPVFATKILKTTSQQNDSQNLDSLRQGLLAVSVKFPSANKQTEQFAKQLLAAIEQSTEPAQIDIFAKGLEKISTNLSENEALDICEHLALLIENGQNNFPFKSVAQAQASLIEKMTGQEQKLTLLAHRSVKSLQNTTISDQFDAHGNQLIALSSKIPHLETNHIAEHIIDAIKDPSQFKISTQDSVSDRYKTIEKVLASLIKNITEEEAENLLHLILDTLRMPLKGFQYKALGQGLAEASAKLQQPKADNLFAFYSSLIKQTTDSNRLITLVEGTTGLAKKLSHAHAKSMGQLIISIINKQQQNYDLYDMLEKSLAALIARTPPAQAGAVTGELIDIVKNSDNLMQANAFRAAIAIAAEQISGVESTNLASRIIPMLKSSNDTQAKVFGKALEAMAKNLPADQALSMVKSIIAEIDELAKRPKDELERSKIKVAGKALKPYCAKVEGSQLNDLANFLISSLDASKATDKDNIDAFALCLAATVSKASETDAKNWIAKFVEKMKSANSGNHFKAYGQGLQAAVDKLPTKQQNLARQLAEIIDQTKNSERLAILQEAMIIVSGTEKPNSQTIVNWFNLLNNPLVPRLIVSEAIKQRIPEIPEDIHSFWQLIEWGSRHYALKT